MDQLRDKGSDLSSVMVEPLTKKTMSVNIVKKLRRTHKMKHNLQFRRYMYMNYRRICL